MMSPAISAALEAGVPVRNGRPDYMLAAALKKVSPETQAKAKTQATEFEAMFLNAMVSQMSTGIDGEGPFGGTVGTGAWRSMLTDQYTRSIAKAGGLGISTDVYRALILRQAGAS